MSTFYDTVIRIISKPSEERGSEEINMILAWFLSLFKKKSAIFGDIKPDVIKDIIKNCSFETKNPDDIIIKQGDVGDCFYINLRGKVSIFINHQKHDVPEAVDHETAASSSTAATNEDLNDRSLNGFDDSLTSSSWSSSNPSTKSKRLRERLGNYVTSLGPGEGFGEVALVRDDLRTASIIADEKTDLMVVNKTLYSRCLQATALRKLNEKQEFINNSPFFGNWQPKMKKLLSLCLERDIIPYDSYLGKQGEPADRMFFIISGQAKLIVNPSAHKNQYPRFYPLKLPENESQDYVNSLIESKHPQHSPRYNGHTNNAVLKRRNETFAEAEQRRKNRQMELGILGPGEISGMCELIFDMPTYMQSTRCLESCDVFYIFRRSYERLIAKRNPNCIGKMKSNVLVKLTARNSRLPIDLFRSIEYKIRLQMKTTTQTQSTSNNVKQSTSSTSTVMAGATTSSMSSASSMSSPRALASSLQHHTPNNVLLPQRGALVQLDSHTYMQTKSKLLNRTRQQHLREKQKKQEEKLLHQQQQQQQQQQQKLIRLYRRHHDSGGSGGSGGTDEEDNNEKSDDTTGDKNATTTTTTTYHPIMIGPNHNIVIMNAGVDLKSLEQLEDKMKKWQLDLGCKKAFVTKMNRVELSDSAKKAIVTKTRTMTIPTTTTTSTTTGWTQSAVRGNQKRRENISNVNNNRRNNTNSMMLSSRSRRSSSSSSLSMDNSSSSDTTVNSSGGESNETTTVLDHHRDYLRMNYVRGHEAPVSNSVDFNANNKLLSFASQSMNAEIGTNISNNSNINHHHHHHHQLFAASAQTFLHSILTNMTGMVVDGNGETTNMTTTTSLPPIVMLNEFTSATFAPEFPTWSHSSSTFLEPSHSQIQTQPDTTKTQTEEEVKIVTNEHDESSSKKQQCRSCKNEGQMVNKKRSNSYYFVKKKFSMSQVKIQANGGRKYSKEEYLALKDELKRQTRRSSIAAVLL